MSLVFLTWLLFPLMRQEMDDNGGVSVKG